MATPRPNYGAPRKPTPLRKAPRIDVQSAARFGVGEKAPVSPSIVLNVSTGGALLFSPLSVPENITMQIELGSPIFAEPRLVVAKVTHCAAAQPELLKLLTEQGKLPAKSKGFLLGVEFVNQPADQLMQITAFIQTQIHKEQKRRAGAMANARRIHTARDRALHSEHLIIPRWIYALGVMIGAGVITTGILHGDDEARIALHAGVPMLILWVTTRISLGAYTRIVPLFISQFEIIAQSDGTTSNLTAILADDDSRLDLPSTQPDEPEEEEEKKTATPNDSKMPPELIGSGREIVEASNKTPTAA